MPINVYASELARFLGVDLIGDDILINRLAPFDNPGSGTLSFLNRSVSAEQLGMSLGSVVITLEENADALIARGIRSYRRPIRNTMLPELPIAICLHHLHLAFTQVPS